MESARLIRRSAKGTLTRATRTVTDLMTSKRSPQEITHSLQSLKLTYNQLSTKHEAYCITLTDENRYEEAEEWMEECRSNMMSLEIAVTDYISSHPSTQYLLATTTVEENVNVIAQSESVENGKLHKVIPRVTDTEGYAGGNRNPEIRDGISKLKKDFVPKFNGNIRDYGIFRSDFKHVVENTCSKRDAMTVLRSSLSGRPAELIRGITNDYEDAWEYLDSVYGDPRYVADAITHDISSFECLKDGEDARFCELVHLIRRSYSTLKELERAEDMNNNHMLALVEQKMCSEDRKVWSRYLVQQERPATFEQLLTWMKKEMEARMRSSAPLRNVIQSVPGSGILHVASSQVHPPTSATRDKCWMCRSSDHWIDQCAVLQSLSPDERLRKITDNHACICCMKRAGNSHTPSSCYRRRQCPVVSDTGRCSMYHHPLLHGAENCSSPVSVSPRPPSTAILPVLSVKAFGRQNSTAVVNTLLDSGAQISLIRKDTAAKLCLKGRSVALTLNKVGGDKEELHTTEYQVRIQSLETSKSYNVKLIEIPCINSDVCEIVGWKDIGKQLNLENTTFNRERGQVDILLGIDHAYLHTGETRQATNGMVARHSPLGWVLFGPDVGSHYMNTVLNVSIAKQDNITKNQIKPGINATECTVVGDQEKLEHVLNGHHKPRYNEKVEHSNDTTTVNCVDDATINNPLPFDDTFAPITTDIQQNKHMQETQPKVVKFSRNMRRKTKPSNRITHASNTCDTTFKLSDTSNSINVDVKLVDTVKSAVTKVMNFVFCQRLLIAMAIIRLVVCNAGSMSMIDTHNSKVTNGMCKDAEMRNTVPNRRLQRLSEELDTIAGIRRGESTAEQSDGTRTAESTAERSDGTRTAESTAERSDVTRTAESTAERSDGTRTAETTAERSDGTRTAESTAERMIVNTEQSILKDPNQRRITTPRYMDSIHLF